MAALAPGELARYNPLSKWIPKVGDFIIHHGWFSHWYGILSSIEPGSPFVEVITEGLPVLLFLMIPEEQTKKKKLVSVARIKLSRGGQFAVLQDGVWLLDG